MSAAPGSRVGLIVLCVASRWEPPPPPGGTPEQTRHAAAQVTMDCQCSTLKYEAPDRVGFAVLCCVVSRWVSPRPPGVPQRTSHAAALVYIGLSVQHVKMRGGMASDVDKNLHRDEEYDDPLCTAALLLLTHIQQEFGILQHGAKLSVDRIEAALNLVIPAQILP